MMGWLIFLKSDGMVVGISLENSKNGSDSKKGSDSEDGSDSEKGNNRK